MSLIWFCKFLSHSVRLWETKTKWGTCRVEIRRRKCSSSLVKYYTKLYAFENSSLSQIGQLCIIPDQLLSLLFLTFQAPPIISPCNKTPTPSIKRSPWIVAFTDYIGYDECSAWTRCSHLCLPDPDMHLFRCECPDNMTAVGKWYWNKTCACPTGQFMDAKGDCNYRKYKKEL